MSDKPDFREVDFVPIFNVVCGNEIEPILFGIETLSPHPSQKLIRSSSRPFHQ
jgi:hypothetical protein